MLSKTNMLHTKSVTTPMVSTPKLTVISRTTFTDATKFHIVIRSLQYLFLTQPDIAFTVNHLSQFIHFLIDFYWQAAKPVLCYFASTSSHDNFIHSQPPLTLHGFLDYDWRGNIDDFISTNAYIIYFGGSPILWSSKKQWSVARSSTKAEYLAVANTAFELSWVCSLLSELGIDLHVAPVVYCDNVNATFLCANQVFYSQMKHVALNYHFVQTIFKVELFVYLMCQPRISSQMF